MSWSVSAIGKPAAVAAKLAEDFARINCAQPEHTIKNAVAIAIEAGLRAYPESYAVKVEASGSQSASTGGIVNQLSVKIDPVWGFCE